MDIHTPRCVEPIAGGRCWLALLSRAGLCGDLEGCDGAGGEEAQTGGYVYTMTDSLCCDSVTPHYKATMRACSVASAVSDSLQAYGLCSLQGSSVPWILQARILEWVAIPFFRGSSRPRDQIHISWDSYTAGRLFYR